jgi:hypothetical protein
LFSCIHYNPHFPSVNRQCENDANFGEFVTFSVGLGGYAVHPAEEKTNKSESSAHEYTQIDKKRGGSGKPIRQDRVVG